MRQGAAQAAGGKGSSEMHSSTGHKHIPGCWAIARSGIPAREPLWNGTICRHPGRWGQLAYSRGFSFGSDGGAEHLEVRLALSAACASAMVRCMRETHEAVSNQEILQACLIWRQLCEGMLRAPEMLWDVSCSLVVTRFKAIRR